MWQETPPDQILGPTLAARLREAVAQRALHDDTATLTRALRETCADAHARQLPVVAVVIALRETWTSVPRPAGVTAHAWSRMYLATLRQSLAMYFGTDCVPASADAAALDATT